MLRRRPIVGTVARTAVIAGTATAVAGGVRNHQAQKAQAQQAQAGDTPTPAQGSDDSIEQLTKLGSLHEQGILTDEEFAAQKAKILAQM
jgi:negative regulator of sigma E activity